MKKNLIFSGLCIICLLVGSFAMYFYISKHPATFQKIITKSERKVKIDDTGISEAVEKVYDSVVTVSTYKNASAYASGTGFVYKKDGNTSYILTNAHVIKNADEVYITLTNGNTEKVEIVGSNTMADIAVLSVDSSKVIAYAEIGSSDKSKIGDTVFAVGAPLDSAYSWTVTRGILSGKDRLVEVSQSDTNSRSIYSDSYLMNVLQTDAAINSGNSGGPLANGNGEVIAITSLKLVSSGVEGMGFAIPIETALKYAEKIINKEEIITPYIGVSMLNINEAYYYREFRSIVESSKVESGVVVATVESSSPASKSGLKQGDIILKIDNVKTKNIAYLRYILYKHEVGDKIKVTYLRDGKESTVNVTLGKNNS
ncbi:MAG: trypsin-like peptidase domain-containing protein [Bacilli bacterium]|nr:trypsin-like peptidase domain-containing protein [Bacilli bacterium]